MKLFGYKIVKESELETLETQAHRYGRLVSFHYWFSETPDVRELLAKFVKGEVNHVNIDNVRSEFYKKMGVPNE